MNQKISPQRRAPCWSQTCVKTEQPGSFFACKVQISKRCQGHLRSKASKHTISRTDAKEADASKPEAEPSLQPETSSFTSESAPRQAVLEACLKTTLFVTIAGLALRAAAYLASSTAALQLLSNEVHWWHAALVMALVAAITGGRLALLNIWPSYKLASDQSNQIVLPALKGQDIVLVSFLPGFSEELLFRGALIPALGGTKIAVLLAAFAFGVLHVGGGRNPAFALWAVFVGLAYGGAYLYSNDLLVPATAHSIANFASATLWLRSNSQQTS